MFPFRGFGAFGASWSLLEPLGASWSLLGPLGASWGLLGPLGAFIPTVDQQTCVAHCVLRCQMPTAITPPAAWRVDVFVVGVWHRKNRGQMDMFGLTDDHFSKVVGSSSALLRRVILIHPHALH